MPTTTLDRERLNRLITVAAPIAVVIAGAYAWVTRPASLKPVLPTVIPVPHLGGPDDDRPVVLPDRGEPRTERLARLERTVDLLRHDPARTPAEIADALLSLAEVRVQLERFAGAQEAVTEALHLVPQPDAWQHREALLVQQDLQTWENSDDDQRRLRRDRATHHEQALRLHSAGAYLDAVAEARQAVALQRRLRDSASTAADEARLADELLLLGRLALEHADTYAEAEGVLQEACERCARTRGETHPVYAEILTALAATPDDCGDFDAADALYQQALDIHRRTRGELSLGYAATLARQGHMHLEWWEDYAWGKCFRALQIREQLLGPEHLECAESLEDLGVSALGLLQFAKAEELFRSACRIREREQGEQHPQMAEAWNWLSQCAAEQGNLGKAHLLQSQAISITRRRRGETHPRLVRYLTNLARLDRVDWNEPRGERACLLALDIAQQADTLHHPAALDTRVTLGELLLEEEGPYEFVMLRRVDPAFMAEVLRQAVAAHGHAPRCAQLPTYAAALMDLAHVGYWDHYTAVSRQEARELLEQALENIQMHGDYLHPFYPEYFRLLGRWRMWAGEYPEARRLLKEHVKLVEQQYGTIKSERRAGAWRALAGCYLHEGSDSPEVADCLRETLDIISDVFRRSARGLCDVDRLCLARSRSQALGTFLLHPPDGVSDGDLYREILLAKGATSMLLGNEQLVRDDSEMHPLLVQLQEARRELKRLAFSTPDDDAQLADWYTAMFAAADEKEELERRLAAATQGLSPEVPELQPADVQAYLPPDTVLLDFLQFTEFGPPDGGRGALKRTRHIGVFVIRHDAPIKFVSLGAAADIDRAVHAWRDTLFGGSGDASALAAHVRKLIWEPIQPSVGPSRHVLVAPDGPICFIPLAALPGRASGTFLLEEHTIGYIPSVRQWVELVQRSDVPESSSLLAVGDVEYQSGLTIQRIPEPERSRGLLPDSGVWDDLPATRAETEQIQELFRQTAGTDAPHRVLSGREPTLATLQAMLSERWRYLHFAGHGFYADWRSERGGDGLTLVTSRQPELLTNDVAIIYGRAPLLLSGVILSPPPDAQRSTDAILTAEEVAGLDLGGTEMVVLSACETALGNAATGEGVLGLQRAFLKAGVRSTVTSLWRVNDAATGLLMQHFYRHLWIDRLPKWEALRQAQLDVLNHPELFSDQVNLLVQRGLLTGHTKEVALQRARNANSSQRSDPALWGAFVLYGDGR
jgi:CHAT domain-containing protein